MRVVALITVVALSGSSFADDWPQYRGPRGDGVSTEVDWTTNWAEDGPPIVWERDLGDGANNRDGSSTFAVVGDRLYAMGTGFAYCLNTDDGEVVWKREFPASHSTPAVHEGRVFLYGTEGGVECVDAATGEPIWATDLRRSHGADRPGAYGYACSPTLLDDKVLVSARIDGGALLAFDQKSGDVVWTAKHAGHEGYALWSTPVVAELDGRRQVVWLSGPHVVGLDPGSGETLWKYDVPVENGKVGCAAASPVVVGNRVVAQYHPPHARGFTFCLEVDGGEVSVAWTSRDLANWYFSGIGHDGCFLAVDQPPRGRPRDMGALQCYDVATGELKWSVNGLAQDGERPVRSTRSHLAAGTLVVAGGRLISWSDELAIAAVSADGLRFVAAAKLPFAGYRTIPVLACGRLYLRARDGRVACLDLRAGKRTATDSSE